MSLRTVSWDRLFTIFLTTFIIVTVSAFVTVGVANITWEELKIAVITGFINASLAFAIDWRKQEGLEEIRPARARKNSKNKKRGGKLAFYLLPF